MQSSRSKDRATGRCALAACILLAVGAACGGGTSASHPGGAGGESAEGGSGGAAPGGGGSDGAADAVARPALTDVGGACALDRSPAVQRREHAGPCPAIRGSSPAPARSRAGR